jgi:hypothetical protein
LKLKIKIYTITQILVLFYPCKLMKPYMGKTD